MVKDIMSLPEDLINFKSCKAKFLGLGAGTSGLLLFRNTSKKYFKK